MRKTHDTDLWPYTLMCTHDTHTDPYTLIHIYIKYRGWSCFLLGFCRLQSCSW